MAIWIVQLLVGSGDIEIGQSTSVSPGTPFAFKVFPLFKLIAYHRVGIEDGRAVVGC